MEDKRIENWVNEYAADLYSWAQYKISDSETAKDLVQDTFLAASRKISSFRGDSSPKTWLFSILNFKIIDFYRDKAKKPVSLESEGFSNFFDEHGEWKKDKRPQSWDDEDGHLLDNEDFQKVLKLCMDALPEKWNACMNMKYMMEKNGEEICQELEITSANFWQIIHRAKLNLRECINNKWFRNEQR